MPTTAEKKKPDFNATHPELHPGEEFLFNAGEEGLEFLKGKWNTLRTGEKAFGTDGKPVADALPTFVSIEEKERRKRYIENDVSVKI